MKITDVQQIKFLVVKPALLRERLTFRAMTVAAGVVGNLHILTVFTGVYATAQCGSSATLDHSHRLSLYKRKLVTVTIFLSIKPEDILQFRHWLHR